MFSNKPQKNNNDELLRLAFQKIKQENQILNEKIMLLEKRVEAFEKKDSLQIIPKQESSKPALKKIDNIEKAKSSLSPSEKEILHMFTMSNNKTYTYEELGAILGKSSNTIKAQIQSIIKKGIPLSFNQESNKQRTYYLNEKMFELVIKSKN